MAFSIYYVLLKPPSIPKYFYIDLTVYQCIVSIVSEPSDPSMSVVSSEDIAEEGINVPTILLLSCSFNRTT